MVAHALCELQGAPQAAAATKIPPMPTPAPVGHLMHLCGCANDKFNFEPTGVQRLRSVLSEKFSKGGGDRLSTKTWSDHIWTFGQFLGAFLPSFAALLI